MATIELRDLHAVLAIERQRGLFQSGLTPARQKPGW